MTTVWRDIDTHDEDSARGLVVGLAIGVALWLVVGAIVWLVISL